MLQCNLSRLEKNGGAWIEIGPTTCSVDAVEIRIAGRFDDHVVAQPVAAGAEVEREGAARGDVVGAGGEAEQAPHRCGGEGRFDEEVTGGVEPTGGRFVYLPEQGWTFAGRQADARAAATVADAGQPVSLFIDEPTGFVFNYVVDQGWVFAGKMDAAR